jgi:cell division transport system permease protein
MIPWVRQHWAALRSTLVGFVRAPLATAMTVAVIGITLALPTGLYVVISNVQRLTSGWEGPGQVSLFLRESASTKDIERLAARLGRNEAIARTEIITPDQALEEFRRHSGFGEILKALDRNPLPAVIVVHPGPAHQAPDAVGELARELRQLPEVEQAIVDLDWVRRLHTWLAIAERAVWLLGLVLAAAVLLIIGNTIRLGVLNRRDEIAVVKLVGGTDGFIRRPFLYAGATQGFLGGMAAWGLVGLTLLLLEGPIQDLTLLYQSQFALYGLGAEGGAALAGVAGLLGWVGSRLAVIRHLRAIEPR